MRAPTVRPVGRVRLRPAVVDALVGGLLMAMMLLSIATKAAAPGQHARAPLAYLLAIGLAAPYAFHRRRPMTALGLELASVFVFALGAHAAYPGVNAFVVLFGIAVHSDRRRSTIAFVATLLVLTVAVMVQPAGIVDQGTWIATEVCTVAAWLGGETVRQRRARWTALQERNRTLEREREDRARQAVTEERLRIARELHDVVAHAMSVIAVQSGVANHVIETQPENARPALAAIETTSRAALTEMRRLLGVLRQENEPDAAPRLVPAPGLRDVPDLIGQVGDSGVRATLRIRGAPVDVPPGIDLSAYRIVQEALTNAIKHGGPRAEIALAYTAQDVTIEVTNDDAPDGPRGQHVVTPGHGILGMRERVAVCGGEFSAHPRPGGGFRVVARLPLHPGPQRAPVRSTPPAMSRPGP